MLDDVFSRFAKNPIGFVKRAFYKLVIGPIKYGKGDDYDAARYWDKRLTKYGDSLRGVGDEGKSNKENIQEYARDEKVFTDLIKSLNFDLSQVKILDIGCGTGFYADILKRLGVINYTGIDITDTLFPKLCEQFPDYEFIKKDITTEKIDGKYDLIIMIEVLEHIVNDDKLSSATNTIKNLLTDNGVFAISCIWETGRKHMFYVRQWSLDEVKSRFAGYNISEMIPFRGSNLITIRK